MYIYIRTMRNQRRFWRHFGYDYFTLEGMGSEAFHEWRMRVGMWGWQERKCTKNDKRMDRPWPWVKKCHWGKLNSTGVAVAMPLSVKFHIKCCHFKRKFNAGELEIPCNAKLSCFV